MAKADLMDYDKALELFEPVLGFEVHVELNTQTKMFSDAPNPAALGGDHTELPNTMITPVDLGLPGSLPVVMRLRFGHPSAWAWRSAARSRRRAASRARTTSTRTSPRTTRSASTTSRSRSRVR